MLKKPAALAAVLAVSFLSGCSLSAESDDEHSTSSTTNRTEEVSSEEYLDSFMDVGRKLRVWSWQYEPYVNGYHRYMVAVRDSEKRLLWDEVDADEVYMLEEIDTSYIERLPDRYDEDGIQRLVFHLYLKAPETMKETQIDTKQ